MFCSFVSRLLSPILVAFVTLATACSPRADRSAEKSEWDEASNQRLQTNFPYRLVNDSTIDVGGEAFPLFSNVDQMYLIGDTLFYIKQTSINSFISYNYQSDEVMNRFGTVLFDGESVYALAQTPGFASVSPLGSGPTYEVEPLPVVGEGNGSDFEIYPVPAGSAEFVSSDRGLPVVLRDSAGFTRAGPK